MSRFSARPPFAMVLLFAGLSVFVAGLLAVFYFTHVLEVALMYGFISSDYIVGTLIPLAWTVTFVTVGLLEVLFLILYRYIAAWERSSGPFRALVEKSPDAIMLIGPQEGRVLYVSPSAFDVLGYEPEELRSMDLRDLLHLEGREYVEKVFANLRKHDGETRTLQMRIRHANGEWHWVECLATNSLHDPEVGALVLRFRDITKRIRTEEKELKAAMASWEKKR